MLLLLLLMMMMMILECTKKYYSKVVGLLYLFCGNIIIDGIGDGLNGKGGQYFELFANNGWFVWLAVCGWILTQSQYRGIDDTPTEKKNN